VARVPSSVVIGPGLSSASFQIVTAKVASPVRIEIRAVAATPMGGTSDVNSVLTLTP
jgi:hypothetical protein